MPSADSHQIEDEFIEAKKSWELEKLYVDLASAKGKALTPVEKKFLRGLLCGCSPAEIAKIVYQSPSSSTVRVYLSNGLYKYIEEMLSNQAGYSVKVKNWSRVTHLLEKAGYKKGWFQLPPVISSVTTNKEEETDLAEHEVAKIRDWGEAIDVSVFYGRMQELILVEKWIVQERCRLIGILGMSGIGKTAFSVKLSAEVQEQFECVIWRSLRFAPPLDVLLHQLLQILYPSLDINIAKTVTGRISQLIDYLRSSRCLLVLDDVDSLLDNGYTTPENPEISNSNPGIKNGSAYFISQIRYRQGYEGYGELIRRLGDSQHQSCVVFTSREKPQELSVLEGETLPVRSLKLTGLNQADSILILNAKGLTNQSEAEFRVLLDWYAGNPLFLKLVATAIQELFGGNLSEFIKQGTVVFGDIRAVLDEQFNRLSQLEKHMMYWLALNQDFISVRNLPKDIIPGISPRMSQRLILEAIELLQRRSLIQRQAFKFSQTPVLMEYVIERLIEENFKLNEEKDAHLFMSHTLFEAHLKNHIRESRLNTEI
ncbi:NB-ARC domain-containing protein [Calothrix sp. PCC 7507]|uniref:NB-ARC domain-containing protein n=1 Tax=Calothrix sp. PCC 7507 TaxID=99598 RepID=UPI00029F25D5|nr:NB-ARC domain-containing protein [Calothrix sp. PCC 7507]AFY33437.1 AAA ATPase [Calothrix sp. PCC 7507]